MGKYVELMAVAKTLISKKGTAAGSVKQFRLKRLGLQKEYLAAGRETCWGLGDP